VPRKGRIRRIDDIEYKIIAEARCNSVGLTNDKVGEEEKLLRPALSFETITFSDGQTLSFEEDDIVVFVGPNNAGKSAALRELQHLLGRSNKQLVITDASLRKVGTAADLLKFLEQYAQRTGGPDQLSYAGIGYQIHHSHVSLYDQPIQRNVVAPFFSARLATEVRITASDPAGAIALYVDPPTHPIHLLLLDSNLANEISGHFRRAFGQDLIVFRAGGGQFPLWVGTKPTLAIGQDELSKEYVEALKKSAKPLKDQGDGMRSFATVLLYVLAAAHHSVQFLDEPEAFLHPPQAKLLGEYIAKNRKTKSQLFIATHSTDVLDGLISAGLQNVRIIRIQRSGSVNRVRELSKTKTTEIAHDTLTRYSGVFEGIFYPHVIIAESDADCLFYSSLLNTLSVAGDQKADVLFIHASGKHRMAQLAGTLKALDVPVSVIADIDVLSEDATLKQLIEVLGGDWSKMEVSRASLAKSVEAEKPPLNAEQIKGMISNELNAVGGTAPFPRAAEQNIKRIFKAVSPWSALKRAGRNALNATGVKHFDALVGECATVGLWVVPEGELEGWCRSIEAGHGPSFAEKVLEERDIEQDPELRGARDFMRTIWQNAKKAAR
jgi:energy-coupling factor transporter ATP-binding protein EcfA2